MQGASSSATTGCTAITAFLELLVGLVTVHEFQRRSRNDILMALIFFSETIKNHKGPNQTSEEDGEPQLCAVAYNCH
jgi:hypothetical protein